MLSDQIQEKLGEHDLKTAFKNVHLIKLFHITLKVKLRKMAKQKHTKYKLHLPTLKILKLCM